MFSYEEVNTLVGGMKNISGQFILSKSSFHGIPSLLETYFRQYIQEADTDTLKKFLKFVTGSLIING